MAFTLSHTAGSFSSVLVHTSQSIIDGSSDLPIRLAVAVDAIPENPGTIRAVFSGGYWHFDVTWTATKKFETKNTIVARDFLIVDGDVKNLTAAEIEFCQALRAVIVEMVLAGTLISYNVEF